MEWVTNQTAAARQAVQDTLTVVGHGVKPSNPVLTSGRIGALARSNSFLWLETNLRVFEHYGRVVPVPVGRRATRATALLAVAVDIISGYALLQQRGRLPGSLAPAQDWEWQHERSARRIRDTAAALGGTLIKACQFASTRPDILPAAYIETLATLQDHVPAESWPVVRRAISRELGRPPRDIFRWIDHQPLASASIAQVHRATLQDGREVVIKVQHPGIGDVMAGDLSLLRVIVNGIATLAPAVRLQPILDHLEQTLPLELDFKREAWAMRELRAALRHRKDVIVPEPILEFSTERLLTMDYVEGIKITDKSTLAKAGLDADAVARLLNDVYAEQMLRLGWLHADPHPGNLLVQAGSEGPRLVLLDHGLTVPLPATLVAALEEIVRALHAGDLSRLADALRRAGMPLDAEVDVQALLQIVGVLLDQPESHGRSNALEIGQRLGHGIGAIPSDLILVGRALGLLDGVTRQLDPGLDTLEIISGYVDNANTVSS